MTDDDRRLANRLREYEDRVPDPPEPRVIPDGSVPWTAIAALGAAAVLIGAFIAFIGMNEPSVGEADPSSPPVETPVASTVPSASPEPTGSTPASAPAPTAAPQGTISGVAWQDGVAAPVEGTAFRITAEGGRFYALGSVGQTATIWSSSDGAAWARADLPFPSTWTQDRSLVYAANLVSVDDRLVAIGTIGLNDYLEVAVWESTDGATWREVDSGAFRQSAYLVGDVTNGPAGLVAISHGYGAGTGSAWRSADGGRTWTEHRPPGDDVGVHAVVGTDRGYLIAGMVGETFEDPATSPRIWYSNDAMTWTPATLEGSDRVGGIEQVAIDGSGRWVAIGTLDSRIVVWRSTDRGLSWAIAADLGAVSGTLRAQYRLAGAPDGFIAFSAADPATTWTSHDGVSWTAGPEQRPSGMPEGLQISWKTGIARIGDTLVVAGEAFGPQPEQTWFSWIGTIER